jgi:hypothetical protein
MRVRLRRGHQGKHGFYPMGTVLQCTKSYAQKLISEGHEEYTGEYPPKKKMKTELFKPKNNGNN